MNFPEENTRRPSCSAYEGLPREDQESNDYSNQETRSNESDSNLVVYPNAEMVSESRAQGNCHP